MIITKIERQKHRAGRVNLYIDGEFALGLDEGVLVGFKLREGDQLLDTTFQTLLSSEEFDRAKQKALHYLSHRMRTEKELRSKLLDLEFPPDAIDQVVADFKRLGLINDHYFAETFVRDTRRHKPSGVRLIKQKLLLKGVPKSIIDDVLGMASNEESEDDRAMQAVERVIKRYRTGGRGAERLKARQRLAAYLARRGFDWSVISPVLEKYFK